MPRENRKSTAPSRSTSADGNAFWPSTSAPGAARRLARAQVRHAAEPHEAAAAVALEAEERARPVVLERAREHARAARERGRRDALVRERAHGRVRDPDLDRLAAHGVVSGKPARHDHDISRRSTSPVRATQIRRHFVAKRWTAAIPFTLERTGDPEMATPTRPCPYCGAAVLMNAPGVRHVRSADAADAGGRARRRQPAKTMFGYAAPLIPQAGRPAHTAAGRPHAGAARSADSRRRRTGFRRRSRRGSVSRRRASRRRRRRRSRRRRHRRSMQPPGGPPSPYGQPPAAGRVRRSRRRVVRRARTVSRRQPGGFGAPQPPPGGPPQPVRPAAAGRWLRCARAGRLRRTAAAATGAGVRSSRRRVARRARTVSRRSRSRISADRRAVRRRIRTVSRRSRSRATASRRRASARPQPGYPQAQFGQPPQQDLPGPLDDIARRLPPSAPGTIFGFPVAQAARSGAAEEDPVPRRRRADRVDRRPDPDRARRSSSRSAAASRSGTS